MTRLFHCLKDKQEELGITVVNVSQRGPEWQAWLQTVLFAPTLPTLCTPFKGVTDIVLIGKNGFMNVVVSIDDVLSCSVDFISSVCVVEVGVNKARPLLCTR